MQSDLLLFVLQHLKSQKSFRVMAKIKGSVPVVGGLLLLLYVFTATMGESDYLKYKDPKQPINKRIEDLMSRMTLAEKIGQMTQIDRANATAEIVRDSYIGSVLSGGGSLPMFDATAEDWVNMVNGYQNGSLSTRLGIPMIYGIDAVHGHNNVYKATIFPHNVGLGATRQVHYTYNFRNPYRSQPIWFKISIWFWHILLWVSINSV